MNIKPYNEEFYEEIVRWWESHGWDAVPKELLPPSGFIVYDGDMMLSAGWLFMDAHVPLGMMEFIVANPDASPTQSYKAISKLVKHISELADSAGILAVYSSVKSSGLLKLYKKHNFMPQDCGMTSVVRGI